MTIFFLDMRGTVPYIEIEGREWVPALKNGTEEKMTITAKYAGKCKACGGQINEGDKIEWTKEDGARHVGCKAGTNRVANARVGYASYQTKRCWECGCNFTYADCKANDGDWSESYCGC